MNFVSNLCLWQQTLLIDTIIAATLRGVHTRENTDGGNCPQDQSYNHTRIKKLCIPAFKGCMQWKTALCTTHERDSVSHVKFHLKKK